MLPNETNTKHLRKRNKAGAESAQRKPHPYLSVYQQEEQELLLKWDAGMEGPRVDQGLEVGADKNGPRRLKIYLPVALI